MGTILEARCECGLGVSILAGGGMSNFETVCYAPALCPSCRKIVAANYLDSDRRCPQCGGDITFYNHSSLREPGEPTSPGEDEGNAVFSWYLDDGRGAFLLPDARYICPQCGKVALRFAHAGFWD